MPSPVSPSRLMFKRARTREPWQRRGESRPRRSPPRRPPCSPAAQRSPAGAAPTPAARRPSLPRPRRTWEPGAKQNGGVGGSDGCGTRHTAPPTQPGSDGSGSPLPPTPGPGPLPWSCPASPRACRKLPATAVVASGRAGAATRGAGEGIVEGVVEGKYRGDAALSTVLFSAIFLSP